MIPFSLPLSREAMETASLMVPMDDQATIDELGVDFRSPRETLRDAYQWLYDSGRIPARLVPALAASPGPAPINPLLHARACARRLIADETRTCSGLTLRTL